MIRAKSSKGATWLDRVVELVAPVHAHRRLRARAANQMLARHYEGAAHTERHQGWNTPGSSAAGASYGTLKTLRDRARDLVRNNGWAKKGLEVLVGNVIGPGIVPRFLGKDPARVDAVREAFEAWAVSSTECDHQRKADFVGVQELVLSTLIESGEVLVRRRRRRTSDKLSTPLQLEVLEPDYLDESRDTGMLPNGGRIVQGVQYGPLGQVEQYWLFQDHPGDPLGWRSAESRPVRAGEILHLFVRGRAGQARGVPHLAPVIVPLRDLEEAEDATLIRHKIAACFVAFRKYIGDDPNDDPAGADPDAALVMKPGLIEKLRPGEDVSFGTPPVVTGFDEYAGGVLRKVAAGFGVTYEELTGDYRRVNFSSGRMGWITSDRYVRRLQRVMRCQFCLPVWAWFQEAAELSGTFDLERDGVRVSWSAPRREMLDPVKETAARKDGVRAGFLSLSDAIREGGRDPREVFAELEADGKALDQHGLTLDTDPRGPSAGAPPAPPAPPDPTATAPAGRNGRTQPLGV